MKKIDWLEKSYQKAKRKEKTLLASNRFQKAIENLRNKWNIPKSGLDKKTLAQWKNTLQKQNHLSTPSDSDIELEIQRQIRIIGRSKKSVQNIEKLLRMGSIDLDKQRVLQNDIGKILIDHKLNSRWATYIEHYLLLNTLLEPPSGLELRLGIDEYTGQETVYLQITEETVKEDLTSVIGTLKEYQWKLPHSTKRKNQPVRNLDVYIDLYTARNSGKRIKDIKDENDVSYELSHKLYRAKKIIDKN